MSGWWEREGANADSGEARAYDANRRAMSLEQERDHALARSIRAQYAADLARKQRDHWRRRAEKAEAHLARILAKEGGNTL